MSANLLEREAELTALHLAFGRAEGGCGSAVLISGEAGVGKTSLVRCFLETVAGRGRILAGRCEDLLTPRALEPLREAARSTPGPLREALAAGVGSDGLFGAAQQELADPAGPTVLVVEDVHWADSATLDVLRYVGRRVPALPSLVVLTYRGDELVHHHPLRNVLGALPSSTHRLSLSGLSLGAVAALAAGTAVDPALL